MGILQFDLNISFILLYTHNPALKMRAQDLPSFKDMPAVKGMPHGAAWGLFDKDGKRDNCGTLNLLTPEIAKEAQKEIRSTSTRKAARNGTASDTGATKRRDSTTTVSSMKRFPTQSTSPTTASTTGRNAAVSSVAAYLSTMRLGQRRKGSSMKRRADTRSP